MDYTNIMAELVKRQQELTVKIDSLKIESAELYQKRSDILHQIYPLENEVDAIRVFIRDMDKTNTVEE